MNDKPKSDDYIKSLVRERDMDRYLAILLSPRVHHPALMALAALNAELGHISSATSEPILAAIRYQYWRDCFQVDMGNEAAKYIRNDPQSAVGELFKTGNPVADGVIKTMRDYNLPPDQIADLINLHETLDQAENAQADFKLLAVDAPLFELSAMVLGGSPGDGLKNASNAAALAIAAAKFTGETQALRKSLADLNRQKCTWQLGELEPEIFQAFLPVSLIEFYLHDDSLNPGNQLKRIWTLWRAHRKKNLG